MREVRNKECDAEALVTATTVISERCEKSRAEALEAIRSGETHPRHIKEMMDVRWEHARQKMTFTWTNAEKTKVSTHTRAHTHRSTHNSLCYTCVCRTTVQRCVPLRTQGRVTETKGTNVEDTEVDVSNLESGDWPNVCSRKCCLASKGLCTHACALIYHGLRKKEWTNFMPKEDSLQAVMR